MKLLYARGIACLIVGMFFGEAAAAAKKETWPVPGDTFFATSPLRIRTEPNARAKIVGSLNRGDAVKVMKLLAKVDVIDGIEDHWAEIRSPKGNGWVFKGYLTASKLSKSVRSKLSEGPWQDKDTRYVCHVSTKGLSFQTGNSQGGGHSWDVPVYLSCDMVNLKDTGAEITFTCGGKVESEEVEKWRGVKFTLRLLNEKEILAQYKNVQVKFVYGEDSYRRYEPEH
jgi:hypothetical protein